MNNNKQIKQLYRIPEHGKIAGVCAGLAERFDIETWLVRESLLLHFFLAVVVLFY